MGRVGIFFLEPLLDSVPGLCSLIELLAREGYTVDIFTLAGRGFSLPTFNETNINVHILKLDSMFHSFRRQSEYGVEPKVAHSVLQIAAGTVSCGQRAKRVIVDLLNWILDRIALLSMLRRHRVREFCFLIGVESPGLIRAALHSHVMNIPLIYYSLEIRLTNEIRTLGEKRTKAREVIVSRRAARVLIQDDDRARLLAGDNCLPLNRFVTIPNAPLGPSSRVRQRYWHDKFQLSQDARVLLYAGGVWTGTSVHEIVRAAGSLPPNWVLIVHTRSNTENSTFIRQCRENAQPGKVYFSLKPVRRQEYNRLVSSADIGIAFYSPVEGVAVAESNLRTLGLSSGKIAYFLRAGLPVIVNDKTSIAGFVRDNECGVVVVSATEIHDAVARIVANYDSLSQRACEVFNSRLDFAGSSQVLLRALQRIEREHDCLRKTL